MADHHGDGSLADSDIQLLDSGNFSDATIICGDRTWNVHRAILVTRSKWFKKAFCGTMKEAESREVELHEEDAEVVDVMLRFIYANGVNLTTLKGGKDVPAFCVKVFRIGDFLCLDELKKATNAELKNHLQSLPTSLDSETGDGEDPAWITEVLDAFREACRDKSTEGILDTILDFVYPIVHKIFRSETSLKLLQESPQMAVRLVTSCLISDMVTRAPTTKARFGLPVIAAIAPPDRIYELGRESPSLEGPAKMSLSLYHDATSSSSAFTAVNPKTGRAAPGLEWMVPSANEVETITSHLNSEIVAITKNSGARRWVYYRFEDCGDAKIFVDRYCRANGNISAADGQPGKLSKKMGNVRKSVLEEFRREIMNGEEA